MGIERPDHGPLEQATRRLSDVLDGLIAVVPGRSDRTADDGDAARHDEPRLSEPVGTSTAAGRRRVVSPEERIVELVRENGGVLKQAEIVASVEWSESTVSRRLSELEREEAVSRYQIGREKVVYLPGHEPEAVRSPLSASEAD